MSKKNQQQRQGRTRPAARPPIASGSPVNLDAVCTCGDVAEDHGYPTPDATRPHPTECAIPGCGCLEFEPVIATDEDESEPDNGDAPGCANHEGCTFELSHEGSCSIHLPAAEGGTLDEQA
jgi:hypothetical protein